MLDYTEYLKIFVALLAVINPLGALSIFIALTPDENRKSREKIAKIASFSATLILIVALIAGEWMLVFFGISVSSFRVGGGILILLMAISMLQAELSPTVQTKEEAEESNRKHDIAVVPLATPLLAGPGGMSTVVVEAHKGTNLGHELLLGLTIIIVGICLWMALHLAPRISQRFGVTGINIFTRIMGLILSAIAVEIIANGIKGLFPALAG
ncbi:YchE family NAAT transporter [Nitrospira sp. T9]|uniref:YchE family NAAT transporter n=1 Tax=unclassified Nitrospira TaxID=2652172 RepID=UPI003F985C2D